MSSAPLILSIRLRAAPLGLAGDVIFINPGAEEIRVWRRGSSVGDPTLSFEVQAGGQIRSILYEPQVYTYNVPTPAVIPPGGHYAEPFDLGDGRWSAGEGGLSFGPAARLVAVYETTASAAAEDHGIWIGRVVSDPVPLPGSPG